MKTRCVSSVESEDILLLAEWRGGVRLSRCDSDFKGEVTDNLPPVRPELFWGQVAGYFLS